MKLFVETASITLIVSIVFLVFNIIKGESSVSRSNLLTSGYANLIETIWRIAFSPFRITDSSSIL